MKYQDEWGNHIFQVSENKLCNIICTGRKQKFWDILCEKEEAMSGKIEEVKIA